MIPELSPESFTASRWRRFDLFASLGLPCREPTMVAFRSVLRPLAVGYCRADILHVRPKSAHVAIMFFRGGHQWCHLTNDEFYAIFGGDHA